jgi:hypothetical protein
MTLPRSWKARNACFCGTAFKGLPAGPIDTMRRARETQLTVPRLASTIATLLNPR